VFQRRAETLSDAAVPPAHGFHHVDCMLDTRYDNAALDEGLVRCGLPSPTSWQ
jgi:hypothetical protein